MAVKLFNTNEIHRAHVICKIAKFFLLKRGQKV